MYVITINAESCQGCGDCVDTCPMEMFELVNGKAVITGTQEDCLGCEACANICATGSITVKEM